MGNKLLRKKREKTKMVMDKDLTKEVKEVMLSKKPGQKVRKV